MKNKKILVFLIVLIVISSVVDYLIIKAGTIEKAGTLLMLSIMWTPFISTMFTLLIFRQSIKTIQWRIGKIKYLAQAFYIPLIYISLAYLPLWMMGFFSTEKVLTLQSFVLPIAGAFINIVATFGEEVGWRGFLFPQLEKQMSFVKAALLTGFIWSIWHIPGLLMTDYGNNAPWYTAVPFFVITLTAISLPMSYLCKKANSVWPAVLFHAAHNAFIQAFYDSYSVKNGISKFLIGETGIALAITSMVLLIIYIRKSRKIKQFDLSQKS
jgi:membrane protease YdiL (CAAX protease family)